MHDEMGEVMQEVRSSSSPSRLQRLIGDDDIAEDAPRPLGARTGNDSTLVGLSLPRHCR